MRTMLKYGGSVRHIFDGPASREAVEVVVLKEASQIAGSLTNPRVEWESADKLQLVCDDFFLGRKCTTRFGYCLEVV